MLTHFGRMTDGAAVRYGFFLDLLRGHADHVMRTDPTNVAMREETVVVTRQAAVSFISTEQANLNEDTMVVTRAAHDQAIEDLGLTPSAIDDRFADFIFSAALHTTRLISAQVERDVTAVAQHLRTGSQRVDLYLRSGRHTVASAVAQVSMDDHQSPAFRFVDRIGRQYKSTKHLRDTYRHHLLSIYNEVYLDVVAEHGRHTVGVTHPDPSFKWSGARLALTGETDLPLYYDVRDEIFHPSSEALLTLLETR